MFRFPPSRHFVGALPTGQGETTLAGIDIAVIPGVLKGAKNAVLALAYIDGVHEASWISHAGVFAEGHAHGVAALAALVGWPDEMDEQTDENIDLVVEVGCSCPNCYSDCTSTGLACNRSRWDWQAVEEWRALGYGYHIVNSADGHDFVKTGEMNSAVAGCRDEGRKRFH